MELRRAIGRGLGAGLAGLVLLAAGCGAPRLSPERVELNVRSFDEVWSTAQKTNYDPTLGGLDWNAVKTELRPRVERAGTMDEARGVMTEMLGRLKQSHFGIIPAEVYAARDERGKDEEGGVGVTGVHLRIIDGKAVVWRVDAGSAGERSGVRTGWVVETAGGRRALDGPAPTEAHALTHATFALEGLLRGPLGRPLELGIVDGAGAPRKVKVATEPPTGTPAKLGHLPTFYIDFVSRRIADARGDVGYIWFTAFLDPQSLLPKIADAVESFRGCRGIVIDLRGNPGGLGLMAMGIAGRFVGEEVKLGEMITRDGTMKFLVFPQPEVFSGKVAVLTDEASASTSEILAGGLQDLGRARVFGARTAGMALPSTIIRLPNGDGFQYAFANYISAGGKTLEGAGVTPDVPAPPTRAALLAGHDNALEAARGWILDGSEKQAQ